MIRSFAESFKEWTATIEQALEGAEGEKDGPGSAKAEKDAHPL
jgi:hypothetical protein